MIYYCTLGERTKVAAAAQPSYLLTIRPNVTLLLALHVMDTQIVEQVKGRTVGRSERERLSAPPCVPLHEKKAKKRLRSDLQMSITT